MKETIALIISLSLCIFTLYLLISNKINTSQLSILLFFALCSGLGISNYNFIKKIKGGSFELETFNREVEMIKDEALEEIKQEVSSHKATLSLLTSNLNDTREKVDIQKKSAETLIGKIGQQEQVLENLNEKAELTKKRIEILHDASTKLALLSTKINWLQIATKHEFGTERSQKAISHILKELDAIVSLAIPEPIEREKWVKEVQSLIPPAQ